MILTGGSSAILLVYLTQIASENAAVTAQDRISNRGEDRGAHVLVPGEYGVHENRDQATYAGRNDFQAFGRGRRE